MEGQRQNFAQARMQAAAVGPVGVLEGVPGAGGIALPVPPAPAPRDLGKMGLAAPPVELVARRDGRPVVGLFAPEYGLEHVTYTAAPSSIRYAGLRGATLRRLRQGSYWKYSPWLAGQGFDLVHTFNFIPRNKPFVVSHEMELPRIIDQWSPAQVRRALEALRSPRCRRILSLSAAAHAYVARRLPGWGYEDLLAKMEVFRGAVRPRGTSLVRSVPDGGPVRMLFIGGDGLRKGLEAAVRAAELLRAGGVACELVVIGRVTETSYVLAGRRDGQDLRARIDRASYITHHESLPNAQIWDMLRASDVLVFPTTDESLGWVSVEAGLCGVPTIATEVFAQPELVRSGETGWLLPMELDEDRRWVHLGKPSSQDVWSALMERLAQGIAEAVGEIARDPWLARARGAAAAAHLQEYHPDFAASRLDAIYAHALG